MSLGCGDGIEMDVGTKGAEDTLGSVVSGVTLRAVTAALWSLWKAGVATVGLFT